MFCVAPSLLKSYGDFPAVTGRGRTQVTIRALFQKKKNQSPSRDSNPQWREAIDSKSTTLTLSNGLPSLGNNNNN